MRFTAGKTLIAFEKTSVLPCSITVQETESIATQVAGKNSFEWTIGVIQNKKKYLLRPFAPAGKSAAPLLYTRGEASYIEFPVVHWKDEKGEIFPSFKASIRYEIFPDGPVFVSFYFTSDTHEKQTITSCRLSASLDLDAYDDVKWGCWWRPRSSEDSAVIQGLELQRFQEWGKDRKEEGGIIPLVSFNAYRNYGPSLYAEFTVEGDNTLSPHGKENSSFLEWKNGSPHMVWEFQKKPYGNDGKYPAQWRCRWSWLISAPPSRRKLPPFTMYHYYETIERLPSASLMKALAEAKCDVLVLHENWRLDMQDDGVPYDVEKLRNVIALAHKNNIRVALYIRGNYIDSCESNLPWFGNYLKKDYDGIYMDYGGASGDVKEPNEMYQGGRIMFRSYYMRMRRLRELVGEEGLIFAHSGAQFCGLAGGLFTGYVSGEGEGGLHIKGRKENEYYSMTSVTLGTLWSPAFPEYNSPKMLPFIAASGQYPHMALGVQFPSCSLAQPPVPGIKDIHFRPLLRLWKTFADEKNIDIYNDCNSFLFPNDSQTGHYLMVSEKKDKALLIVGNFSAEKREISLYVQWQETMFVPGGKGKKKLSSFLLVPNEKTPGKVQKIQYSEMSSVTLEGYGVAGLLFDTKAPLEYEKPYPAPAKEGKAWLQYIEEQRSLRKKAPAWKELYLTLAIPNLSYSTLEQNLMEDLYSGTLEIVEFMKDGTVKKITDAGINGVGKNCGHLDLGDTSKPIALHKLFSKGKHFIGLRSLYKGKPFYSFVTASLSPEKDPEAKGAFKIEYIDDLEPQREFLRFHINIK